MDVLYWLITAVLAFFVALSCEGGLRTRRELDELEEKLSNLALTVVKQGDRIEALETKMEAIPVEDMKANVRQEREFFEGLQNIMNYNGSAVPRLNLEGLNDE